MGAQCGLSARGAPSCWRQVHAFTVVEIAEACLPHGDTLWHLGVSVWHVLLCPCLPGLFIESLGIVVHVVAELVIDIAYLRVDHKIGRDHCWLLVCWFHSIVELLFIGGTVGLRCYRCTLILEHRRLKLKLCSGHVRGLRADWLILLSGLCVEAVVEDIGLLVVDQLHRQSVQDEGLGADKGFVHAALDKLLVAHKIPTDLFENFLLFCLGNLLDLQTLLDLLSFLLVLPIKNELAPLFFVFSLDLGDDLVARWSLCVLRDVLGCEVSPLGLVLVLLLIVFPTKGCQKYLKNDSCLAHFLLQNNSLNKYPLEHH